MKYFKVFLIMMMSISVFGQSAKDYKAINTLLASGIITETEAKIMSQKLSIPDTAPQEIKQSVDDFFTGSGDPRIQDLFKTYLEEVGVEPFERTPSNYTQGSPAPSELGITDFLPAVAGFEEVLEGFIPFLVALFSDKDTPKPLAIFRWINYGKVMWKDNPDQRYKF